MNNKLALSIIAFSITMPLLAQSTDATEAPAADTTTPTTAAASSNTTAATTATTATTAPASSSNTTADTNTNASSQNITLSTTQVAPEGYVSIVCPAATQLTKNDSTWSALPYFKSFDSSSATAIKEFNGAQWTGAGEGQIFCVYSSTVSSDFPITMAFDTMAQEPVQTVGLSWKDTQTTYINCISKDPQQCPFLVKEKPKKQSLDSVLSDIKSDN